MMRRLCWLLVLAAVVAGCQHVQEDSYRGWWPIQGLSASAQADTTACRAGDPEACYRYVHNGLESDVAQVCFMVWPRDVPDCHLAGISLANSSVLALKPGAWKRYWK
jgi:hypothetical protein